MTEKRTFYERKRPAHQPFYEHGSRSRIIFLTVCAAQRQRLFDNSNAHRVMEASWEQADSWVVGKYIIMPDHIHLFCAPVGQEYPALKTWVRYWKSISAREWPNADVEKVWQRDFWDTQLRRGENYSEKWNYVVNNPVRAGLVGDSADWPYQGEMCELFWHD